MRMGPRALPAAAAGVAILLSGCGSSGSSAKPPAAHDCAPVNNDTTAHNMTSNPHPEHTDCPEINSVGLINAGQTKRTDNMVTNRSVCGFHDHDRPDTAGLQGSITIQ